MEIDSRDVVTDIHRPSGYVRLTHVPTGIWVEARDVDGLKLAHRLEAVPKNLEIAWSRLRSKLGEEK